MSVRLRLFQILMHSTLLTFCSLINCTFICHRLIHHVLITLSLSLPCGMSDVRGMISGKERRFLCDTLLPLLSHDVLNDKIKHRSLWDARLIDKAGRPVYFGLFVFSMDHSENDCTAVVEI